MSNLARVSAAALSVCLAASLVADVPSRPANAQELAVIEKVVHAIDATLDRFATADWPQKSASKHEHFNVAKQPDRPLNFALQEDRTYEIKPGSPLFNTKVKPVLDEMQRTKDMSRMVALSKEVDGKLEFTVEGLANVFSVGGRESDMAHDIGAKGAAFSFCNKGQQLDCYVVFGDAARWKPNKSGGKDFVYAHPRGVPAVENLYLRFHAKSPTGLAADRIRELIRTTDWRPIEASLTK